MNQGQPNNLDKRQMSEEELQRTQVLNLDDFRKIARIEKIGSKKPAIMVGLAGLLLIILGTAFPAIQSYNARKEAEKKEHIIAARVEEEEPIKTELTCVLEHKNVFGGGNDQLVSVYSFEDNKLKSLHKEYELVRADPKKDVPFIEEFKKTIAPYLVQTDGYSLTIRNVDYGFVITTKEEHETVDLTKVPDYNKNNYRFTPEFEKDTTMEVVKAKREQEGYKCE